MATKKPFIVKHGLEITGNTSITGSILPAANNIYDLGSAEMVWRDVFIGPGSLYVNGTKVIEDDSNTIVVKADPDQSLTVKTTGTGETSLQSEGGVNITATGASDIQITAGGNIEMKSNMTVLSGKRIIDSAGTQVEYGDNIEMNGNKITGLGTPVADTDAATKVYVDDAVADLVDSAPDAINTLNELSAALGDDANFATTLTTNLSQKLGATASVTLTGDVSGSGSFSSNAVSIAVTVADDSHNHIVANVDGLQDALDSKTNENDAQDRLANTNAYIATKLNASSYTASDVLSKLLTVDGAASTLDADLLDGQHGSYYRSWDNATNKPSPTVIIAGDVTGSATMTELSDITIVATVQDDSHNHIIGNVDGLQTALDSKLDATDYNASDVLTKLKSVDGAGSGLDADSLDGQSGAYYTNYADAAVAAAIDAAPDALNTLNELAAALGDDANFASTLTTNLAQKLGATASVSLTGDVSGSGSFSSNAVSISVTVADDSHNHIIGNVDGLQSALDSKLAASSYTATDVLNKMTTVDGAGSGLDADKLDGQQGSYYQSVATSKAYLANTNAYIATKLNSASYTAADVLTKIKTVDGAGSGLDADLLDGQSGAYYRDWTNVTNKPDPTLTLSGDVSGSATFTDLGNATLSVTVGNDSHNHSSSSGNFTVGGDLTVSGGDIVLSGTGRIQGIDTVSSGTDAANKSYVDTAISNLIGGAPAALDTLNELAAAINDDASYAASITSALGGKLNTTHDMTLTLSGDVSGSATFTNMGNATLSVTVADDSHNHTIANIDGLQTALNGKAASSHTHSYLPLSGGTVTGSITQQGTTFTVGNTTSSNIVMVDTDHGNRTIHCNSNNIGFLKQDGNWGSYCDDNGNWTAAGNVTAYSDMRLKDNIETIGGALDKVMAMRGCTYTKNGAEEVGVIAQEMEAVLPQVVNTADDEMGTKSVAYGNIVAVLIEAIKEQQAQIEELKNK